MIENPTLPDGWQSEPLSSRELLITAPGPRGGYVTVDFDRRCFSGGCVHRGRPENRKTYEGRGWKQSLLGDAVKWLGAVIQ